MFNNFKKFKQKYLSKTVKSKYIKYIAIAIFISLSLFAKSLLVIVRNNPDAVEINVNQFFRLVDKPLNPDHPLIVKEKKKLLNYLSYYSNHKINEVNIFFYGSKNRFGNQITMISKIIFFCELLGCKKIILDKSTNWFIKNKIHYSQYNMSIETGYRFKYENRHTLIDLSTNWLYYFSYIKPELRSDVIKQEILNNIPNFDTNPKDLYIHIRSGDIFEKGMKYGKSFYSQPPLCFYKMVISSFKFKSIYIIAINDNNPVINKLIQDIPSINYKQSNIKIDIAYLVNAHNIVASFSTFLFSIIRLNDKLKYIWEYNLSSTKSKIIHGYHSYFKPFKNITYYIMEPSENYKAIMNIWNGSKSQLEIMINEKCNNTFLISKN